MLGRVKCCSVVLLAVMLGGCKGTGGAKSTPSNLPPTTKVTALPPPVKFSLCSDGLPTAGMWKCDPVLTDVNGDGHVDLAAHPRLGSGPRVWLGDSKGTWTESSTGLDAGGTSCGGGLTVTDMNRDGYPDIVVGDHCQGVFVYLGNGMGKWDMVTKGLHPAPVGAHKQDYVGQEDADAGDVNGDGYLDIVSIAMDQGGITLFLGDGTGTNWIQQTDSNLPVKGWGNRVKFYDVNQDKKLDIIASMGEGPRVWLGDGRGGWTLSSKGLPTPMAQGLFGSLSVGDVNSDGRLDLAFANWIDGPEIFLQEPDGTWLTTKDAFPDMLGGSIGITLMDLDLDHNLDMVVSGRISTSAGFSYGLYALQGDGRGGWRYLSGSGLPETGLSSAWGVSAGDVNGDGILDLAYGTGGHVAADPDRREPTIPTRLMVWCTELVTSDRAVLANLREGQSP